MAGLHPPKVAGKLVPVFTGSELALLEHACAGRGFDERRDAAIIAVLKASGSRNWPASAMTRTTRGAAPWTWALVGINFFSTRLATPANDR